MTTILRDLLRCLKSLPMKPRKVEASNLGAIMETSLPSNTFTAPKRATLFLVGACCTTGFLSSGGTHIEHRDPCCWKWHSSRLQRSIFSFLASRRSFFKILLCNRVCLGNDRAGFSQSKSHRVKDSLTLPDSQLYAVLPL